MLPKDILQYARKFSPAEIEKAIMDAIQLVGKAVIGIPTDANWGLIQEQTRRNLNIPNTLPAGTTFTPYTTTNAYSTEWTSTAAIPSSTIQAYYATNL